MIYPRSSRKHNPTNQKKVQAFKRTEKILLCGTPLLPFVYAQAGQAFSAGPTASVCNQNFIWFLCVQNANAAQNSTHANVGEQKPFIGVDLTLYATCKKQTVKLQHWLQSSHGHHTANPTSIPFALVALHCKRCQTCERRHRGTQCLFPYSHSLPLGRVPRRHPRAFTERAPSL